SIGGSYYLGKNKQHADWVQTTNEVDKNLQKIVLLESELELLKLKLEDFDGDGVSNYQDDEPNTAPGATVDSRGVTIGNLSGVEITTKQKPSVINSVTNSDKDTTFKIVYKDSSKPDKDKDGVPDEFDICPEIVGTYKGCPDADGDFIPDITDDCPSLKGTQKNHGCPENGIIEKQIILQTVPEIKNEKPLENQVEIEVKETLLSEVFFEIGSSILSTKALNQLDLLVKLLVENPKLNVSAVGVADQTGSQSVNEKLSLKRVNECVDYMVKKGINRERFIVSYKVAINTNGTNKLLFGALNRKVTFTVKK
ncbi:MAG: OmpA family protein, partial [Flavobacteriales bacterium]|nr:OmpA family protein [Flavobacteriales bacterium]